MGWAVKIRGDIWTYAEKLIGFYKSYYKEEVLVENSVGLPDEMQLALELKKQKEYCESGQDRKALEHLKKCLGIYPKLEKVMLTYAEMVRNKMQQQITEAKEAQEGITTNDHLIEKYCKAETGEWRNCCCESHIKSSTTVCT